MVKKGDHSYKGCQKGDPCQAFMGSRKVGGDIVVTLCRKTENDPIHAGFKAEFYDLAAIMRRGYA
uniref:Uncharacterized protein n=1 Tax=viral metagenome TaxID=1070528 RepID=A0A6M3JNB1_9ZZZZ